VPTRAELDPCGHCTSGRCAALRSQSDDNGALGGTALGAVFEALPDEPIKATACPEPPLDGGRLGNGVVQRAVVKVLASAQRPLTVLETQAAVVDLLGHPVSKGSINCCLSTGALGSKPRFERTARGCYRLAVRASQGALAS
jgi:hypothetical protein